jgi:hypothetical protein
VHPHGFLFHPCFVDPVSVGREIPISVSFESFFLGQKKTDSQNLAGDDFIVARFGRFFGALLGVFLFERNQQMWCTRYTCIPIVHDNLS